MKSINLKALVNIYIANGNVLPKQYVNYIGDDYGLEIKENELIPLVQLINNLNETDMKKYNGFYLGYKIPQIGKEFDLLRFDDENVLNIEYKREVSDINKIEKQLLRNKYYLEFLNKNMILISYIQNIDKIYMLKDNRIAEISYSEFIQIISDTADSKELDLNEVFRASNYLVSPFNKTEHFMEQRYFLTEQQEKIEVELFNYMKSGNRKFLIQGDAGTGKTLLTYHIAKVLNVQNKKIALIHCGSLNDGQLKLINNYSWNIYSIKDYLDVMNKKYDILILDEVQRIHIEQLERLEKYVDENNIILILSGDKKQILRVAEKGIIDYIEKQQLQQFMLSKKIRSNKELADFISTMLDLSKKNTKKLTKKHINITYFNSYEEADRYVSSKRNFSFIPYTSTLYPQNGVVGFEIMDDNINTVGNPHQVIGQEFENVGVLIDKHFYYDNNLLKAENMKNNVYSPRDMLYQAMTRVIKRLEVIIVENIEVFNIVVSLFEE